MDPRIRQLAKNLIGYSTHLEKGEKITDGMTIEGMGKVKVDEATHTILGNETESLDKANLPKLVKMGL